MYLDSRDVGTYKMEQRVRGGWDSISEKEEIKQKKQNGSTPRIQKQKQKKSNTPWKSHSHMVVAVATVISSAAKRQPVDRDDQKKRRDDNESLEQLRGRGNGRVVNSISQESKDNKSNGCKKPLLWKAPWSVTICSH